MKGLMFIILNFHLKHYKLSLARWDIRLSEKRINDFKDKDTIKLVIVRCRHCKNSYAISPDQQRKMKEKHKTFVCIDCSPKITQGRKYGR